MGYVNTESIRKAFNIFLNLIERTEIKKSDNPGLFSEYEDPEVSNIVHLMEEEADIIIIRSGDTLYYSPKVENRFLGFTNAELRNALRLANNTELYLVYVIILGIIIKFYSGEDYNNKVRTMLKIEELESYITEKMESIMELTDYSVKEDDSIKTGNESDDNENTLDEKLSYNFSAAAKLWVDMPAYDEKIIQYSLSTGTRISYVFRTVRFLREQGLANIDNENEIFTTNKMDALIMGYYPESSRKREILSFLKNV